MVRPFRWAAVPRSSAIAHAMDALGSPDSAAQHHSRAQPATLTEPAAATDPNVMAKPEAFAERPAPISNNESDTVILSYAVDSSIADQNADELNLGLRRKGGTMAVIASSKLGRTRWDVFAEAIQGGWASTTRLAVLLVLCSTPPCGACILAFRLIEAYLHHRLYELFGAPMITSRTPSAPVAASPSRPAWPPATRACPRLPR